MIVQNWNKFSGTTKAALLTAGAGIAVIGGLAASAYTLHYGLKVPVSMPNDLLLWPKAALAGYTDQKTVDWIKVAGFAGLTPALVMAIAILRAEKKPNIHGDAQFADEAQIVAAEMRAKTGLIAGFTGKLPSKFYGRKVNKWGGLDLDKGKVKTEKKGHLTAKNMLMYGGPEHMFLYAPTRSGKGVSVVVPNLLNWPDSTVVLDIKKENWKLTAGFRKASGQEVFLFDPLDEEGRTHRWNPLSIVRRGTPYQIEDLQRIADLFIPVQSKDPFFDRAAQTALVGVGGYLAETPDLPFTLGEIYRQLTLTDNFVRTFRGYIEQREEEGRPFTQATKSALNDFLSKSDATFESVKSTITANLGLFANPLLDNATSESDFSFSDLRKKRMSIYVGVSPNSINRMAPLVNLFFQSCVDANLQELPEHNPDLKYQVLLCMDEFTAVGEMPSFQKGIGYFAGYGLKVMTIIQTPAQLSALYGRDGADAYMDNAGVTIVFTPKNLKEAQNISDRLGTHGIESKSETKSKYFTSNKSHTVNSSDQKRSLMMPQELLKMDHSEAIILIGGFDPIKAKKIRYFAEEAFLERSSIPAPAIAARKLDTVSEDLKKLQRENAQFRKAIDEMAAQIAAITSLKAAQEENVAKGEPAEVPMTEEEISNPDTVSYERMALSKGEIQNRIKLLNKAGKVGTKKGAVDMLEALGVHVDPSEKQELNRG